MALEHQTKEDDKNGGRGRVRNEEMGCSGYVRDRGSVCGSCSMGRELELWYDDELHVIA